MSRTGAPSAAADAGNWVLLKVTAATGGAADVALRLDVAGTITGTEPLLFGSGASDLASSLVSVTYATGPQTVVASSELGGLDIVLSPRTGTFTATASMAVARLEPGESAAVLLFFPGAVLTSVEPDATASGAYGVALSTGAGAHGLVQARPDEPGPAVTALSGSAGQSSDDLALAAGAVGAFSPYDCGDICSMTATSPSGTSSYLSVQPKAEVSYGASVSVPRTSPGRPEPGASDGREPAGRTSWKRWTTRRRPTAPMLRSAMTGRCSAPAEPRIDLSSPSVPPAGGSALKTTTERIGTNKVKLAIEVPESDVRRYVDAAYRTLSAEMRIPGFRPGRVPRPIIDQRLGKDFVRSEALKEALPEFLEQAVTEADLEIVAMPEVDLKSFEDGHDLVFEAVVEVKPVPELKDYVGLEVSKPPTEPTEAEVDEQIERLRLKFASLEDTADELVEGQFAQVDLTTTLRESGEALDDLSIKDITLEVGAGQVPPDLDAALAGHRKGDAFDVDASLPDDREVTFHVEIKETKRRQLPELDDELARTASEFDTLGELRADVRERIGKVKAGRSEMAVREAVLDAFVERGLAVELPDGMVNLEIDRLVKQMMTMLKNQGASLEAYLEHEGTAYDELRERLKEQAGRNITLALGLEAVAKAENLQVTDKDRAEETERLAARIGADVEQLREAIGESDSLDGDILRAKALDLLVERARITEEAPA